MASTSVPMTTLTYESTVNAARSGKSKLWGQTFRCRRIWVDASPDDRLAHFKTILKTELPERRLKDTGDLQHLMRDFLQKTIDHGEEICYPYIDDFSFGLDQTKSKLNYPIVNERYFQADLKRCLTGNESILQRTVMMHIISQYWLGENFDWNCEGKWTQPKDSLVPSTKDDQVSSPKPDLAISFTLRSFIQEDAGADPIPDDLEETLSPNGVEDINRCFPFLFMEVKQAGADLQNAYMTNLHTASQALHNMYTWIVRTKEKLEDFFRTARVFSLVLNAHNLSVRVHRLHPLENGAISYRFDEIWPLARYSQIEACLLIKTIVNEYAAKELHPILKRAFAAVTEQEHENVYRKRKTDHAAAARSSNRPRNSQDTGEQDGDSHLGMGSSLST